MKIMTIVGTRPEIIKLSRIIAKLDQHVDHVLVHTGQNFDYELNEVFFKELEIRKPQYFLGVAGDSPMATIANVLVESDKVFEKEKPDAVLFYGDTNSCLAVIAAKRRKIPIFHMEAGNRCFDQRVPEELNRKIVDHLSDINMPLSEHARANLLKEGLPTQQIIKTGSCMQEVFNYYENKIEASSVLAQLGLLPQSYILVSLHREENIDYPDNLANILESLRGLHREFSKTVIVSTHPRTRNKLEALGVAKLEGVSFLKPFGFLDYIKLQKNSYCVVSDSGTITEESSLLNFPAITIRNAHERPEGMDAGTLIMSGTDPVDVVQAVRVSVHLNSQSIIPDYQVDHVSDQVLKILLSYTHYVNRFVWRKNL